MRHSIAWPRARRSLLLEAERLARGDADLLADEIDAVQHLGNRMLDLDARVHLHEIHVVAAAQKIRAFPRCCIALLAPRRTAMSCSSRARAFGELGRRSLFDQLLVRRLLHRAIAFAHVHDVAERHRRGLALRRDAERSISFSMYRRPSLKFASASACAVANACSSSSGVRTARIPFPPPPAVALSKHRIAELLGGARALLRPRPKCRCPGVVGTLGFAHDALGRRLVAHLRDDGRATGR